MLPDALVFPASPQPIPEPVKSQSKAPRPIRLPSLRHHKASGQAVVTIGGRDLYLGKWGTAAAKAEYRLRVAEYLTSGGNAAAKAAGDELTIVELCAAYLRHARTQYDHHTVSGTVVPLLTRLKRLYGPTRAVDFGPLALKTFRHELLGERNTKGGRLSRGTVNRIVKGCRGIFKWAAGEELIPVTVLQALQTVEGLRYGRTDAPDYEPVGPVPEAHIEAVTPHLPEVVAAMVRLMRLTGARPGEVCAMTTGEIDTTGAVWFYRPRVHKTKRLGKDRIVASPSRPNLAGAVHPSRRSLVADSRVDSTNLRVRGDGTSGASRLPVAASLPVGSSTCEHPAAPAASISVIEESSITRAIATAATQFRSIAAMAAAARSHQSGRGSAGKRLMATATRATASKISRCGGAESPY